MSTKLKVATMIFVLVASLALAGCGQEIPEGANYTTITGQKLEANRLDDDLRAAAVVVDVRDTDEYAAAHLIDAINIPLEELESRAGELEESKKLAVIVYSNNSDRSESAAEILTDHGFIDVKLAPGIEEFQYTLVQ